MVMNEQEKNELLQSLSDLSQEQDSLHKLYEDHVDAWWNKLSENERQQAFYAVCKRIHAAEVKGNSSYRGVLYNTFGFGPDMYGSGMECGFFELHNQLFDGAEYEKMSSTQTIEIVDNTGTIDDIVISGIRSPEYIHDEKTQKLTIRYDFSGTGSTAINFTQ